MVTATKGAKSAISQAAEALMSAHDVAPSESTVWTPCTTIPAGKRGLAKNAELVSAMTTAVRAEETADLTWNVVGDLMHAAGIRAEHLSGDKKDDETYNEVRTFIAFLRFGNVVAAESDKGVRTSAADDMTQFWGTKKSAAWQLMSPSRRDLAKQRSASVTRWIGRVVAALATHDERAVGTKTKKTLEEQFLNRVGEVLLFLQGIDLTKNDPKFDWKIEFDIASAQLVRAKEAVKFATGAVVATPSKK